MVKALQTQTVSENYIATHATSTMMLLISRKIVNFLQLLKRKFIYHFNLNKAELTSNQNFYAHFSFKSLPKCFCKIINHKLTCNQKIEGGGSYEQ